MNIFFRVDSSTHIGTGHLMRCVSLAIALRNQGHHVRFICRELPGNSLSIVENYDFTVFTLPFSVLDNPTECLNSYSEGLGDTITHDVDQTLSVIKAHGPVDWLVIDHYSLDISWENACRPFVKKIMVIDDLDNRPHNADLLLNQNCVEAAEIAYKEEILPTHCKVLAGPKYALLREEFIQERKNLIPHSGTVNRILVSLGGSDLTNKTEIALKAIIESNYSGIHVDVVMGANCLNKINIKQLCDTQRNFHFHYSITNMAKLMRSADLAIGAAGTTTWERCCLGLPSLVIKIANNQDPIIKLGNRIKIFDFAGDLDSINSKCLATKINEISSNSVKLINYSLNGMKLVDGLGCDRVTHEMINFH